MSVVVIAANSIITTSTRGPDEAMAYADRVRPAVDRSTRQAAALDDLRGQAPTLGATGLRRNVDRLVRDGRDIVASVDDVSPPKKLRQAHGLLRTALETRADALASFSTTLGAGPDDPFDKGVDSLVAVGRDLAVADRAYQLFLEQLPPPARQTMPASTWVPDDTRWARPEMSAFLATLRASASVAPVHDVGLITVDVEPAPVGVDPGQGADVRVLPLSKTLKLQVVVANAGNTAEKRVPVEAVLTSQGGMDTGRQFVDLAPGQRQTVTLSVRVTAPGTAVIDLRVRVGPVADEAKAADNEQSFRFTMRS
ncbi:MAG TPA: hypothetical protein VHN98_08170 [Acidimicrobiales bacterium]|nr:hypothetical protein [Acidimicrobiales bacterium]